MATYTRLGQVTGELRYVREWISRTPILPSSVRTTDPFAGNACVDPGSAAGRAFGFALPEGVHTRGGGHFMFPSTQTQDESGFMFFPVAGTANHYHEVRFDYLNSQLVMYVDNISVDTIPFADAGIIADSWIPFGWNFNPGSWFVFYINGTAVLGYSDTFSQDDTVAVFFGNYGLVGASATLYFDDVWVDQVVGEGSPATPPRKMFLPLSVTSPGFYDDWNPVGAAQNYQCIDDPSTPDGDTTHNYSDTPDARDTFNVTDVTIPDAGGNAFWRIAGVIPQAVVRKPDVAENLPFFLVIYDGLNVAKGAAHTYVGPDYLVFWDRFPTEPDGSSWSESDINGGMEIGYSL